jgi:phosphomannomutase
VRHDRRLAALPTRDALLPILCILSEVAARRRPLAQVGAALAFKAAASNRLTNVAPEKSAAFVTQLQTNEAFLSEFMAPLGGVARLDDRDGLRILAGNGEVVHFRPSGNAPELRVYVEADGMERAEGLLAWGMAQAERQTVSLSTEGRISPDVTGA